MTGEQMNGIEDEGFIHSQRQLRVHAHLRDVQPSGELYAIPGVKARDSSQSGW